MDSSVDNKPGQNKKGNKKKENNKPNSNKNASPKTDNKASKVKEEVFLCLTLAVSGRSPLNGWIMNIGATLITAERKVLGVFERNLLPLHADVRVKPAPDVVGYWRRQRAELEYFYADKEAGRSAGQQLLAKANPSLRRVPPAEAFEDLTQFCSPYVNLTLVGSPLLSVYGWISYYWSRVWQKDRQMPWGFSGLCARSFSAGYLGVPMKKLNSSATFTNSLEGYKLVGLPAPDSLTSAISFSYFHWLSTHRGSSEEASPPPVSVDCELPPLFYQLGAAPSDGESKPLEEWIIDAAIRDGIHHHCDDEHVQESQFTRYPSIANTELDQSFVEQLPSFLTSSGPEAVEWVATEKVHGSNLTIYTDGREVWSGKRTSLLSWKDSPAFFDYAYLLQAHRESILSIHAQCLAWVRQTDSSVGEDFAFTIAIVCELAGGDYPHPAVPVDLRGMRVQRGVYYSASNFLYGFDIALELSSSPSLAAVAKQCGEATALPEGDQYTTVGKDDRFYLPFDTALQIFREANFPCAEVLHRGPLHSLLQLSPEFLSGVAATLFGLPPLPASYDNKAEGYVVRPVRDVWVCTNTEKQKWSRVIIKMKHPKFSEFAHTKEGGADGEEGTVDLTPFLTTGRVESVLSKYTSDEQGDHARMVQAVLEDAMKDAEKVKR